MSEDDNRPFPIQRELSSGEWGRRDACTIPWWLAEIAYESYVRSFGHSQTLERLAERGGFGRVELVHLLRRTWELSVIGQEDHVRRPCSHEQGEALPNMQDILKRLEGTPP